MRCMWPDEDAVELSASLTALSRQRRLERVVVAVHPEAQDVELALPQLIALVDDGVDLDEVAELTGLSREEVVDRHSAPEYVVAFLGFAPGFAYLLGGDERLHVPRLPKPRERVPGGTVAIAGPYSGIYPRDSPGGWRLLGRTTLTLFDARRRPPALLAPGDRVRFVGE